MNSSVYRFLFAFFFDILWTVYREDNLLAGCPLSEGHSNFQQSILNARLEQEEVLTPEAIRYQNALKVAFAGHLVFEAKKV